jgi:hypothetical protein
MLYLGGIYFLRNGIINIFDFNGLKKAEYKIKNYESYMYYGYNLLNDDTVICKRLTNSQHNMLYKKKDFIFGFGAKFS